MATNAIKPAAPNDKALLQNGEANRLRIAAARWRNLHLVTAFVVAAWLLMMTATGVVVNHQIDWGLDEIEIRNAYLPGHYTTEFSPDSTRLNVVITDLHSGRFFWEQGKLITDTIGLLVFLSVFSGFYAFRLRKKVVRLCREICDLNCVDAGETQKHFAGSGPPAEEKPAAIELPQPALSEETREKVANVR